MTADGAPVERLLDVARQAAGERLPARPAGARQGRARRCAAPTSTSSSPRSGRARAQVRRDYSRVLAQRNALLGRIRCGPRVARDARRPGTASSRAARSRCAPTAPRPSRCWPSRSPSAPRSSGCSGAVDARVPAPLARRRRGGVHRRAAASASPAISSAASPATGPTATSSRCCATGASCASTARRASSAWRCWRCCSPSARCSPRERGRTPLMLLDDVMSELDAERRELLAGELRQRRPERDRDNRPRARARRDGCVGHAPARSRRARSSQEALAA